MPTLSCPFEMLAAATELAFEKDFKASVMFINMAKSTASASQCYAVSILAMCVSSQLSEVMALSILQEKNKHTEFAKADS